MSGAFLPPAFVTITTMEMPTTIIYPYCRNEGYVYLHLPKRLTDKYGVTSGVSFAVFIKNGKIVIEQVERKER